MNDPFRMTEWKKNIKLLERSSLGCYQNEKTTIKHEQLFPHYDHRTVYRGLKQAI